MNRVLRQIVGRVCPPALALMLALAGPGCAHAGKQPPPSDPPGKTAPAASKQAGKKSSGPATRVSSKSTGSKTRRAATRQKPRKKAQGKKGGKTRKSEDASLLDPQDVLALQMQALEAQRGKEDAFIQRQNRVTGWMDRAHERTYLWMDDAVRKLDMSWLRRDAPYDCELSRFKLRAYSRVGGKGSEKNFDFKVRFRADMALPGVERRLRLYVDNASVDSLPGADPLKQESETRLGVRTMLRTLSDRELGAGGGLRWRDSHPVAYLSLDWRWEREVGEGRLRLAPRGFYYTDDGFGQKTELVWTRPLGARKRFQICMAERSAEHLDGVEFEQTLRFAWLRSGRGRGWVAQASVFPALTSSDWVWADTMVNLTWRDALYRKWMYYTIAPQLQFPKEDEYEARPSIRIGVEILFGCQTGELM